VIIFDSVRFLYKKSNQTDLKKNQNEPKPVQTDLFWFGLVFYDKNWFKPVWLGFFGLARFWLGFFWFGSVF
jgi:hypothetical protein